MRFQMGNTMTATNFDSFFMFLNFPGLLNGSFQKSAEADEWLFNQT
jgi:hypothetical protein